MDELIRTIRPRTMGVELMAELTTKDSCQAIYQGMGEIIFHAKSWRMRLLAMVAVAEATEDTNDRKYRLNWIQSNPVAN